MENQIVPILKKNNSFEEPLQNKRKQIDSQQQILPQQYLEPKTFISENFEFILIELELVGVSKENIKYSFNNSIFSITAPKNEVYQVFDGIKSLRNPKSKGVYRRILKIKIESIDIKSFKFNFEDSILFIKITKPNLTNN